MFEWLVEIEKPYSNENSYQSSFKMMKLESPFEPIDITEVGQLFAAYSVIIGSDAMTQIPTPNETSINIITTEIIPHYRDVKGVYNDGVLQRINVKGLKPTSKRIIENKLKDGIYPVVTDLYRNDDLNLATGRRSLKYFSIRKEEILPLITRETEKLEHFFHNTFFAKKGSVFFCPTGWILEEKLRESVAIRTFIVFASSLVLVVDASDNRIVGLDIYAQAIELTVYDSGGVCQVAAPFFLLK